MRIFRAFLSLSIVAVGLLGAAVFVGGCSNDGGSGTIDRDADKAEQRLLHERMQKGFAHRPDTRRG